jgi:membrane associated rhomboid family serine protease
MRAPVLPLRDSIRPRRRPWVTIALIVINTVIFVVSLAHGQTTMEGYYSYRPVPINGFDRITLEYGFTPCELGSDCEQPDRGEVYQAGTSQVTYVRVAEQSVWLTLVTAMFMHGSWLHLIGNMLFLWVFGNAVEDAMPRLAYLLFYLACGFAADLTQWVFDTGSGVPNIGASGAISGVLGAYVVLYPRARVLTGIPLAPLFLYVAEIPAFIVLLTFFVLQLIAGGAALVAPEQSFGIAYFAHIGGFVAGLLLARPMATRWRRRRRSERALAAAVRA